MIRILLAGGSRNSRMAVAMAIAPDPDAELVAMRSSFAGIVSVVERHDPGAVLLVGDNAMEDMVASARMIMQSAPRPIVLVLPREPGEADTSLLLQQSGALAVLKGPCDTDRDRRRFMSAVRAMAGVKVVRRWNGARRANGAVPAPVPRSDARLVAIASSTGGPGALQEIFAHIPAGFAAPIMVVQHIAGGFVDSLIGSFRNAALRVKLAESGERLHPGTIYLAPDDLHMGVSPAHTVTLSAGPPVEGFRPSANFLFETAAKAFGSRLTAVILTGMGRDGVSGLHTVRQCGGTVIAQDRATSIVFGMPKAAIEDGVVNRVLPLNAIAREIGAHLHGEGSRL